MAQGNKLYPLSIAFYLRGDDLNDLRTNTNRLNALLLPNGLQPITQEADLLSLDAYIRNLPMSYDPRLDKLSRRSRLVFSRHTANLLPVYGRSRGTGHPGLVFFNRGAEPLVFDTNGPALWLKLVRAITSVLLEAYRAGEQQCGGAVVHRR